MLTGGMRRSCLGLVLWSCLWTAACGDRQEPADGPTPPAEQVVVASSVSARSPAHPITSEFIETLDETIRKSQERLIEEWKFFDNFSPLGMSLDQLKSAETVLNRVLPAFKSDLQFFSDTLEDLSVSYPQIQKAPDAAVYVENRAWAYRFRYWTGLDVLVHTSHLLSDQVKTGRCNPIELMLLGNRLENHQFSREGVLLFRHYCALLPEGFRRFLKTPAPGLAMLLYDNRLLSMSWLPGQWTRHDHDEIVTEVNHLVQELSHLPGQAGEVIHHTVRDLWAGSLKGTSATPTRASLEITRDNFRQLRKLVPAAAFGLDYLAKQAEDEMAARSR